MHQELLRRFVIAGGTALQSGVTTVVIVFYCLGSADGNMLEMLEHVLVPGAPTCAGTRAVVSRETREVTGPPPGPYHFPHYTWTRVLR